MFWVVLVLSAKHYVGLYLEMCMDHGLVEKCIGLGYRNGHGSNSCLMQDLSGGLGQNIVSVFSFLSLK